MIEKISNLSELQKKYNFVSGRQPKEGDLVYVAIQHAVFKVVYADRMNVRIELGLGRTLTLPFSHYKLIEKK